MAQQNYTEFWARKMKKVFCVFDPEKKGYITLQAMYDTYGQFIESYPKVQKDKILKQHERAWRVLYNCGQEVPPDHQLTEEQYLKNMWVSVNKPNFIDEAKLMSREVFDQMDLEHKGYITKAEFLKLNAKRAGEENALAAFNKMDVNLNGMVEFDELVRSKCFYYTDVSDEKHPFNLIHGPLEKD